MEKSSAQPKLIDIEKVFADKNPKLLKTIPKFVINYLKKVIHQDDINHYVASNTDKSGVPFAMEFINQRGVTLSQTGLENIPTTGRYIFVANHPLGGFDGIAFLSVVGSRFPNIKFPVNDILLNIDGLKSIFVPINKHGAHGKEAAKILEDTFASDNQVLFFPAGMVSRKIKGKITDLEWKKTIIKKAIAYNRDIVPVHISGHNSNFFYNLANIRKKLGIKANIEMLYLPDEMFNVRTKNIKLTFGQPVPCEKMKNEKSADYWIAQLRQMTYRLGNDTCN